MKRTGNGAFLTVFLLFWLALSACSINRQAPQTPSNNQSPQARKPAQDASALGRGEADGNYTCEGETVALKYAYAGRGERFGRESIIVLLTDKPIPAEAVAEEIQRPSMLYDQKIRGLEYIFEQGGDFYWVSFHPDQYQETKPRSQLMEFSVAQDTVTGSDENDGHRSNGRYKCSVRFVAALVK